MARVICSARAFEDGEGTNFYYFMKLVVAISNWGYCCLWVDDIVLRMARILVDHSDLEEEMEIFALDK